MPPYRRQAVVLVLVLGVVALVAQLAGVGGTRSTPPRPTPTTSSALATIPGGSVPDIGSTKLASTSAKAGADEVVQIRGEASLVARKLGAGGVAQVVCGLRYSRDGDRGWSLGTPYETIVLTKSNARDDVVIERSFTAPAKDTYRVAVACHLSSPQKGARVTASGETRVELGLPDGAAIPVD